MSRARMGPRFARSIAGGAVPGPRRVSPRARLRTYRILRETHGTRFSLTCKASESPLHVGRHYGLAEMQEAWPGRLHLILAEGSAPALGRASIAGWSGGVGRGRIGNGAGVARASGALPRLVTGQPRQVMATKESLSQPERSPAMRRSRRRAMGPHRST